jgi:hypothetical protein
VDNTISETTSRPSAAARASAGFPVTALNSAIPNSRPTTRSDLGKLLGVRAEPVEARQQRGLQCLGNVAVPEGVAAVEDGLGQLLNEERHTPGALADAGDELLRECCASGGANHLDPLSATEAAERQCCDVRMSSPPRLELRTAGDHHQHRDIGDARQQVIDELTGRRVEPMGILEDQQSGVTLRQSAQLIAENA